MAVSSTGVNDMTSVAVVRPFTPLQAKKAGGSKPTVSYSSVTVRPMNRDRFAYRVPMPPSPDRRVVSIVPGSQCSVFSKSLRKAKTSSTGRGRVKVRSTSMLRA